MTTGSAVPGVLRSGNAVLVVGFLDRTLGTGDPLELSSLLLERAGAEPDSTTTLREAVDYARAFSPADAHKVLEGWLGRGSQQPKLLERLLQGPWARVYDLSGTRLLKQAVERLGPSSAHVHVDASEAFHLDYGKQQVVSLCGCGWESLQFETPDYSSSEPRSNWFRQLAADLATRPVLVLSDHPHDELWQALQARVVTAGLELPYAAFVGSSWTKRDVRRAERAGLEVVERSVQDLLGARLQSSDADMSQGLRTLARLRRQDTTTLGLQDVPRLVRESVPANWEFLRGYDPTWSDVAAGNIVRLKRLSGLRAALQYKEPDRRNIVVLRGRAGSGKTTLLMRLAFELTGTGLLVLWLDRNTTTRTETLLRQAGELQPDVVLVDDLDMFGDRSADLLRGLNRSGQTLVVASVRVTQWHRVEGVPGIVFEGDGELQPADLAELHDRLEQAGLLGELVGFQVRDTRIERLRELSQRDLLGGLIRVVTGQRLEDRVASEYAELPPRRQRVYALVCLYEAKIWESAHLREDDLVQVLQGDPPYSSVLLEIEALVRQRLLVRVPGGIKTRHRAIADAVFKNVLRRDGATVAHLVRSLLLHYARRAGQITDPAQPDRRNMVHLLSHTLMRELDLKRDDVRGIYASVQQMLQGDYHFWLQRGAYEVERGDLDLADTYLESARAASGGERDYKVTTEWGLLRLLGASRKPAEQDVQRRAVLAWDALYAVVRQKGNQSPHTFAVMLREGGTWLASTPALSNLERIRLLRELQEVRDLGLRLCGDNREFIRVEQAARSTIGALSDEKPFPLL